MSITNELSKRPAGATVVASSVIVYVANKLGLGLTPDDAVAIVGGITALVSLLSPRAIEVIEEAVEEIEDAIAS